MNLCVNLKRGKLDVAVRESLFAPDALFGFAERKNPKRAFLFVSKVLGRHIPVKPSVMQQTYENLAAQVPTDLPGPVIVFGMAETAVGLGAGVHRALQSTRDDTFYLVSSRHDLGTPIFARFEEEHSHASAHLIHMPADAQIQAMLGPKATSVSLLSGSYAFTEDLNAPLPDMPDVSTTKAGVWPINPRNDWGRLGAVRHQDSLKLKTMPEPGEKVLVVGTNEFVWRPFLLAERLEKAGVEVYFSSTTRSPIALGHEIKDVLAFGDNYGLGIPNFLYNVGPGQFDRVFICTETDPAAVDSKLLNALNAEVVTDV
jgi:hypothetical protein